MYDDQRFLVRLERIILFYLVFVAEWKKGYARGLNCKDALDS
jgi:hypothetical protein